MVSRDAASQEVEQPLGTGAPGINVDNPGSVLERFYAGRHDRPPVNACLSCLAVGFSRYRGDWLGVLITPWFVDLYLLPGGGEFWGDIPSGQRRYVELPLGTVPFTAADDPGIGSYQYSPLISPVSALPDMAAAVKLANDVLSGIFGEAARLPMESTVPARSGEPEGKPEVTSRRGFLRRLTGKR
jgi:[NiFe] hydrogenase assembly HybE family chaperone